MKFWRQAIRLFALCIALVGCRSGGNTELIEQEAFQLSEQVLRLEVQVNQLCREVEYYKSQLAACEQSQTTTEPRRDSGSSTPPPPSGDRPKPPKVELGPANGKDPAPAPKFESPPKITPGSADGGASPDRSGPTLQPFHQTSSAAKRNRVAFIMLDPQFTDGWDADERQPGDEGIVVVVEPRNEADQPLRAAGDVIITAWDARLEGKSPSGRRQMAHVATWNFNARDAATWLDPKLPRLHFELKWPPAGGPKNPELAIQVQFTTEDGRKLEASTQILVQRSGRREKAPAVAPGQPHPSAPTSRMPSASPSNTVENIAEQEFSALKKRPAEQTADSQRAAREPPKSPLPERKDVSDTRRPARPEWRPYR